MSVWSLDALLGKVDATAAAAPGSFVEPTDHCKQLLYGPLHYDRNRGVLSYFDGDLTKLPSLNQFTSVAWTPTLATNGQWNVSTLTFNRAIKGSVGTLAKTFYANVTDGETLDLDLSFKTNDALEEGDIWQMKLMVDGNEVASVNSPTDTCGAGVSLPCGQHTIEYKVLPISGQWMAQATFICGTCVDGVYASKGYVWGSPEWILTDLVDVTGNYEDVPTDDTNRVINRYWPQGDDTTPVVFTPPVYVPTDHPCKVLWTINHGFIGFTFYTGQGYGDATCDNALTLIDEHGAVNEINGLLVLGDDEGIPTDAQCKVAALAIYGLTGDLLTYCHTWNYGGPTYASIIKYRPDLFIKTPTCAQATWDIAHAGVQNSIPWVSDPTSCNECQAAIVAAIAADEVSENPVDVLNWIGAGSITKTDDDTPPTQAEARAAVFGGDPDTTVGWQLATAASFCDKYMDVGAVRPKGIYKTGSGFTEVCLLYTPDSMTITKRT